MNAVIDDLVQYDQIYRSDGPIYSRFRNFLLRQHQSTLNTAYRQNTYIPLRILLLETTRRSTQYSLNNLMVLLQIARKKYMDSHSLTKTPSEAELAPWHTIASPLQGPGPISALHLCPGTCDYFAFSTIDGAIHFVRIEVLQPRVVSTVNVPTFSFVQFQWINTHLIVGTGFAPTAYLMSSDSHLWELSLPSVPSETTMFPQAPGVCVYGDRAGALYSFDLSNIPVSMILEVGTGFRQPTTATLSQAGADVTRICKIGQPITTVASVEGRALLLVGTSECDVFLVAIEARAARKWKNASKELRSTSIEKVSLPKLVKDVKPVSVDALSAVIIDGKLYFAVNMRNEKAAVLVSEDQKRAKVVKEFRLPSVRARCPVAISEGRNGWVVVAGTDAGDLALTEQDSQSVSLALHEVTVVVLEWIRKGRTFLSGDISSVVGIWTRSF
jgi:hypothetical protein